MVLGLNSVVIVIALGLATTLGYGYAQASSINRVALERNLTPVSDAEAGSRVINILLVGSDSSAGLDPDDPIQVGRQGEHFGDVIIIAHLDEANGRVALLSLPRDLWVDIAGTDRERRINAAFEIGGPGTLIDTIESNFDIPIHHYVNVDFAGFQGLVAAVGSVDVYFETPARDWDPRYDRSRTGFLVDTAGCHALDPEQALAYVRSRYYQTQDADGRWVTDPTSDLGRIRRQQDFLRRLAQKAINLGARNPFVLTDLVDTGLENVVVDQELSGQLLLDLGAAFRSFDPEQMQTFSYPALDGTVGTDQVLLPRATDAEPILNIFRGAAFDDPSTVAVTVSAPSDGSAAPEAAAVLEGLTAAGFEPAATAHDRDQAVTVIEHGPDGAQAAELVRAALASSPAGGAVVPADVALRQVDWLVGRTVQVVIAAPAVADTPESPSPTEAPPATEPSPATEAPPATESSPTSSPEPMSSLAADDSASAGPSAPNAEASGGECVG